MEYYTKPKKRRFRRGIIIFIIIAIVINLLIIFFDNKIMPAVLELGKASIKNKTVKIISEVSMEAYDEIFKNEEPLKISKDKDGKINMISANTVKLNRLNGIIATRCNEELQSMGVEGIRVPLGWMTDSSIYYNLGPSINIEVEPIGNVETNFESKFESSGINQTRYSIYIMVKAKINIQLPMYNEKIEVVTEVPLVENIIVGEIPDTSIDLGINKK